MTATGNVTAVDELAVSTLATSRLRAAVAAGRDLVKDSLNVTVGQGNAHGADIVFPVQASAQQVRRIVAADLRDAVRGKSLADARATLEGYGTTTIELWPGFASSIPNFDFRIDLTVRDGRARWRTPARAPGSPGPASSASPKASAKPLGQALGESRPVSRLLGIDLGERRIGLAIADRDGSPASPLATIRRAQAHRRGRGRARPRHRRAGRRRDRRRPATRGLRCGWAAGAAHPDVGRGRRRSARAADGVP